MPTRQSPSCGVCGQKMMKNGYTSAGRHRWRCPCGASQTLRKPGKTRIAIFTTFLSYLLGKLSQAEISTNTGRGLRRRWAWCWTVPTPTIQITGQVHNQLFIDGIYLPHKWCLLRVIGLKVCNGWACCGGYFDLPAHPFRCQSPSSVVMAVP